MVSKPCVGSTRDRSGMRRYEPRHRQNIKQEKEKIKANLEGVTI